MSMEEAGYTHFRNKLLDASPLCREMVVVAQKMQHHFTAKLEKDIQHPEPKFNLSQNMVLYGPLSPIKLLVQLIVFGGAEAECYEYSLSYETSGKMWHSKGRVHRSHNLDFVAEFLTGSLNTHALKIQQDIG